MNIQVALRSSMAELQVTHPSDKSTESANGSAMVEPKVAHASQQPSEVPPVVDVDQT